MALPTVPASITDVPEPASKRFGDENLNAPDASDTGLSQRGGERGGGEVGVEEPRRKERSTGGESGAGEDLRPEGSAEAEDDKNS